MSAVHLTSHLPPPLMLERYISIDSFRDVADFFAQAFFVGKPKWSVQDIPDLSGKTAIVTGGSSGIGKDIVKALLVRNAGRVYIASRNQQIAEETIADLHEQTGRTAFFLPLDLADLASVKAAAEHFVSYVYSSIDFCYGLTFVSSQEKHLHILFNNGFVHSMFVRLETYS